MKREFQEQINMESHRVFPCNLTNLNLVIKSYKEEMEKRVFELDDLKAELFQVIDKYQRKDLSKIPPQLCRQLNESKMDYIERIYEAHGCGFFETKAVNL